MKGECEHCGQGVNHNPRWCDECVFELGSSEDIAKVWERAGVPKAAADVRRNATIERVAEVARQALNPFVGVEPIDREKMAASVAASLRAQIPESVRESSRVVVGVDRGIGETISATVKITPLGYVIEETETLDVPAVFGPGGPLAKPGFEVRPGQVELSEAVYQALENGEHVVAEGPCGIGKSKAYGVPASYLASTGRKVLIVTATHALQEQLVGKDLPDLAAELPWAFTFELMKGRSNYLCKWMLSENDDTGLVGAEPVEFERIKAWAQTTDDGDKAKLPIIPSGNVWRRFSVSTDECLKKKCDFFDTCHANMAKERASRAGIVVTNYHMLMLHLQMGGFVLPSFDAIVLDEAHETAGIARELLGFSVSEYAFKRIAKEAEKRGYRAEGHIIREAAAYVFGKLARFVKSPKVNYQSFLRWAPPIDTSELVEAVKAFVAACPTSKLVDYAHRAVESIVQGMTLSNPDLVVSIEVKESPGKPDVAKLVARYVEPGAQLEKLLWAQTSAIAAVSATLATDRNFAFVRKEMGVPPAARELIVETPFNFKRQAMLVLPDGMPQPNDEGFSVVAARRLEHIAQAAGGRTMGLFTSYRALRFAADHMKRAGWHVLAQGDAPVGQLVEEFKRSKRAVLLGTSSLWTGVDIQGEALSAVVIDRIPFASPDDPIAKRISELHPKTSFAEYTVPRAILQFRQGVGRLIRSARDVGVVVILDPRMTGKGYGKRFLRSVPEMQRGSVETIRGFLEQGKGRA